MTTFPFLSTATALTGESVTAAELKLISTLPAALSLAIPLSVPSERWPLLSLPRFGLTIFPLFLALAVLGGRPRAHTAIVAVSSLLLGVSVAQWALWQWVA